MNKTNVKMETSTVQETTTPKFTHTALGVFRVEGGNQWNVAKVSYNPLTGEAKVEEIVNGGEGIDFGRERFKIMAGNLFFSAD